MHHDLKIFPGYFESVISGRKTFEIRNDDRTYAVGDTVTLFEHREVGGYTGRTYNATIGYVTAYKQQPGYVVFSLLPANVENHRQADGLPADCPRGLES
jgi:hypothetical protein